MGNARLDRRTRAKVLAMDDPQQIVIDEILSFARTVAVVGISDNAARPSNEVAGYLIRQDFNVIPVNPTLASVFEKPCYRDLRSVPVPVDVVDVFRRSSEAGAIVDEAIAIGAPAVWLQEGVIDEAAAERARAAGLLVVMDRCMLKEHSRRAARERGFS